MNMNIKLIKESSLHNWNKDIKLSKLINIFHNKEEIRFVGGCIRDVMLGYELRDIDFAINCNPQTTINILTENRIKYHDYGHEHGSITAIIDDHKFEITSLRKDIQTYGRYAKVEYTDSWEDDSIRRDFTMNAIYLSIDGNIYDYHNGIEHIHKNQISFIGEIENRIKEDYLRILRYIRFFLSYSKKDHNYKIKKIIKKNIDGVIQISSDRLLNELKKLFNSNAFFLLPKDKFCLEIINLIFPQLKNINILKNLNKLKKEIIKSNDFIFLISLMTIDETDNSEYFLYKFNISNEDKKRIRFLKNIFFKPIDKNIFSEKNLWKILYFNNNKLLNDLLNFEIFRSKREDKKLIKLKEFFSKQLPPKFNIKAKSLMEKFNLKEGRELGYKLKQIESAWIDNSFQISDNQIEKIIKG